MSVSVPRKMKNINQKEKQTPESQKLGAVKDHKTYFMTLACDPINGLSVDTGGIRGNRS